MTHDKSAIKNIAQEMLPLEQVGSLALDNRPDSTPEMEVDLGYAEANSEEHTTDNEAIESIQTLPLSTRVEDYEIPISDSIPDEDKSSDDILTLSEIVDDLPPPEQRPLTESQVQTEPDITPNVATTQGGATEQQPSSTKNDNPFLPQHILDKLSQGRKDLAEDIVQSSAALDISTALLRTHARADHRPSTTKTNDTNPFASKDQISKQKQQIVDDLVDEYLPLVAAELRRRLHKLLDK